MLWAILAYTLAEHNISRFAMASKYSLLFQPLLIRQFRLRNRIVMPAMASNRKITAREGIEWYREWARGGVGLVIVEPATFDRFNSPKRRRLIICCLAVFMAASVLEAQIVIGEEEAKMEKSKEQNHFSVPGVVIDYSPAETGKYIGSPSIAILPNGYYVASHDFFGPGTTFESSAIQIRHIGCKYREI